jgi:phospholipase/lecithinase/hemolysin
LTRFSTIYAFGDSLSDAGNISFSTSSLNLFGVNTEPVSPPYYSENYGGTSESVFSNGPTWVQDLSLALGLGTLAPSLLDGNDFAYGGAETGDTPQNAGDTGIDAISLPGQLAQYQLPTFTPLKGALYTLSVGGNDIFDILGETNPTAAQQTTDIDDAVANEVSFISALAADGAKNFLVLNVPDLGKVPEVTQGKVDGSAPAATRAALASSLASEYNSDLAGQLGTLAARDSLSVNVVDVYALIDRAVADPAAYGLSNVTIPVWNGNFTSANSGTLAASGTAAQDQFLFFDDFHPTETGAQAVANLALADLEGLAAPPCFLAGTRIATPRGPVAVEQLRIGEAVHLAAGGTRLITWLGHRSIDCRRHPRADEVAPVHIAAGAFAPGRPARDLWLSPDHAIFVDAVLIPARYLVNHTSIRREPRDSLTYWHVELPEHDVLLAEDLPCETYLDTGNRNRFGNAGQVVQLHTDVSPGADQAAIWAARGCAPLHIGGDVVAAVSARLRRRAIELGFKPVRATAATRRYRPPTSDLAALLRPAWYLATNPDVAAAGMAPALHYRLHGRAEGRLPCPAIPLLRGLGLIEPALLAFGMADVIAAGLDPVVHFCTSGWKERRRPNRCFDTGWYVQTHNLADTINPLLHYVLIGEAQGLAPSRDFDPLAYRRRHPVPPTHCLLSHRLLAGNAAADVGPAISLRSARL